MKILTYEVDGRKKLGIWNRDETWIYPIELWYRVQEDAGGDPGDKRV